MLRCEKFIPCSTIEPTLISLSQIIYWAELSCMHESRHLNELRIEIKGINLRVLQGGLGHLLRSFPLSFSDCLSYYLVACHLNELKCAIQINPMK